MARVPLPAGAVQPSTRNKTSPATKATTPKKASEAKLSTEELIAKMDRHLPKWKQYNEDRKAKVPREKRRGLRKYGEFERCYSALRAKGLKLRDARAKTN
jgi:hypothetical protein